MLKESHFDPPWWLRNRHLQTFWGPLTTRLPLPQLSRQRLELSDGDFIDMDWVNPDRDAPTVVLLHGLEGDVNSPYLRRMIYQIQQRRWRGVLVYWRGCSEDMNRLDKTYHSGRSDDLAEIIQNIQHEKSPDRLFVAGYSLGANVLLKWMGENGHDATIDAGCAVSTPFDLAICADSIEQGFSKIYKFYLLNSMKKRIVRKFSPERLLELLNLSPRDVMAINSFREFDNRITSYLNNFEDADDYYRQASSIYYLGGVERPALIIHAADDPFMSPEIIPSEDQLSNSVELLISERGGHVGFVTSPTNRGVSFYLEQTILDYFDRFL
ncbi:hydrolase [Kangiella sediminilitoris]|uniref:Alpha/beta hydrolase fold protein n=1 Tax=Kangiella sediminilitoris TaxID=1144748 RepID=A0A1B3B8G8_9GAMM|nr:hydrolase [Kangiella sediminilitoris]AOE49098.1 Alpha/beta hydrolase fold protein [Kangiella sediminilitoris]